MLDGVAPIPRTALALFAALTLLLGGCSSAPDRAPPVDAGPSYIDGHPASTADLYREPDAAPDAGSDGDASDTAYVTPCWTYSTCGGSWKGWTCPHDYQPHDEAHCVHDDDPTQPDGRWCCYGSVNP